MGFLRAVDEAIEARRLLHVMENSINELALKEKESAALLELYWRIWDLVSNVVRQLEQALISEGQSVAVTFLPGEEKEASQLAESSPGYRVPRRGGDSRGTLLLPSLPPDEETQDEEG